MHEPDHNSLRLTRAALESDPQVQAALSGTAGLTIGALNYAESANKVATNTRYGVVHDRNGLIVTTQDDGTVKLTDLRAPYHRLQRLEQCLAERGYPFDAQTPAHDGNLAECRRFRCGMAEPFTQLFAPEGQLYATIDALHAVVNDSIEDGIEPGALKYLTRLIDKIDPEVTPLELTVLDEQQVAAS